MGSQEDDWTKYNGKGNVYNDPKFPATSQMIAWKSAGQRSNISLWTRIKDMYGNTSKTPSLWGDKGVLPTGIKQGSVGDCWFLSAASALAEHPDRIKRLFENKEYSEEGIYKIHFFFSGRPTTIVIDDRLPARGRTSYSYPWALSRSANNAWWGPILEKAYAKFNVNYSNINGGWMLEAFRDMAHMPGFSYWIRSWGNANSKR